MPLTFYDSVILGGVVPDLRLLRGFMLPLCPSSRTFFSLVPLLSFIGKDNFQEGGGEFLTDHSPLPMWLSTPLGWVPDLQEVDSKSLPTTVFLPYCLKMFTSVATRRPGQRGHLTCSFQASWSCRVHRFTSTMHSETHEAGNKVTANMASQDSWRVRKHTTDIYGFLWIYVFICPAYLTKRSRWLRHFCFWHIRRVSSGLPIE